MELVKYVRKGQKIVGAVVAVSRSQVGWSLCKPVDEFSKVTALDIARVRAVGASCEAVPRSLVKEVSAMTDRSNRYFKLKAEQILTMPRNYRRDLLELRYKSKDPFLD